MSERDFLPQFTNISIKDFPEKLKKKLDDNLLRIDELLHTQQRYSWENLMLPMEEMEDELEKLWSPLSHLHSVVNSDELRTAYKACLPCLTEYESAISHNEALYQAIKSLDSSQLNAVQNKIVEDNLRGFRLSGVALDEEDKKRFQAIQTELSTLSNQFEDNILDSVNAFELHITDKKRLEGLPKHAIHAASELAKEKDKQGFILTLQFPSYIAVMTYAEDRALREEIYQAYATRASEKGPQAGQFDNSSIMEQILALRYEKAQLLGFKNYAELSLASKMAESTDQVMEFLLDLSSRAHRQGEFEFKRLEAFGAEHFDIEKVEPWDIAYLSEKKKQKMFSFSQEDIRPYLPENKAFEGMFAITNRLYGIEFEKVDDVDVWHQDVDCFKLRDEQGQVRGYIYSDLFARANKRGGAWMDVMQTRRKRQDGSIQLPVATLTCNFARPAAGDEARLSHDELLTMFHEFGHCLHHVLSKVDYLDASGVHGVEWDAVELPSQFFENWCWEQSALALLTGHVETGEPLPPALYDNLLASKNFQSAMAMLRQLEFSLFDFKIHSDYAGPETGFVMKKLAEVQEQTTVVPVASYNRFPHSFSHIFAGGYAAGYYSYKWAEVLSSDAYSRFEDEGIFNSHTGRDFMHFILEVGGSKPAMDAFVGFRGRKAKIDALLKHNGIK